jgi:hypothetical protein
MTRTLLPMLLAALLAATAAPAARAAESVFTDTRLDRCENLIPNPEPIDVDMGVVSMKCPGYAGYPYWFDENDVRQSTHFGYLSDEIRAGAGETFETFNHVDEKIEWRLDAKGVPRATILRYFIENVDPDTLEPDSARYGQVLVISRVGQPDDKTGCVTAYVDALANADAEGLARMLADTQAPGFPCGREEPVFHGKVGDKVSEPVYNFPDLSGAK